MKWLWLQNDLKDMLPYGTWRFLGESLLLLGEVALFPRKLFLLLMKIVFLKNFICSVGAFLVSWER